MLTSGACAWMLFKLSPLAQTRRPEHWEALCQQTRSLPSSQLAPPYTLAALDHWAVHCPRLAPDNRMSGRQMSCRQQPAPPPRDAAKMSPRISIGPEPVLVAHAPSPPAAGSHCPAREEFSSPLRNRIFTSYGTLTFLGERTGSFPFSFSLSLSLRFPLYVEGTSLTTSLRYQDLVRI